MSLSIMSEVSQLNNWQLNTAGSWLALNKLFRLSDVKLRDTGRLQLQSRPLTDDVKHSYLLYCICDITLVLYFAHVQLLHTYAMHGA